MWFLVFPPLNYVLNEERQALPTAGGSVAPGMQGRAAVPVVQMLVQMLARGAGSMVRLPFLTATRAGGTGGDSVGHPLCRPELGSATAGQVTRGTALSSRCVMDSQRGEPWN